MLMADPQNQRLKILPITPLLAAVGLLGALVLHYTDMISILHFRRPWLMPLLCGCGSVACFVLTVWRWRTVQRTSNAVNVTSKLKHMKFSLQSVNVFVEREEVRGRHGRKRTYWEVGLEERSQRVVLETASSSADAQALASKVRNSLGLSIHKPWTG
jgi:hypothetical protein